MSTRENIRLIARAPLIQVSFYIGRKVRQVLLAHNFYKQASRSNCKVA